MQMTVVVLAAAGGLTIALTTLPLQDPNCDCRPGGWTYTNPGNGVVVRKTPFANGGAIYEVEGGSVGYWRGDYDPNMVRQYHYLDPTDAAFTDHEKSPPGDWDWDTQWAEDNIVSAVIACGGCSGPT
jgi:hypothetical protein